MWIGCEVRTRNSITSPAMKAPLAPLARPPQVMPTMSGGNASPASPSNTKRESSVTAWRPRSSVPALPARSAIVARARSCPVAVTLIPFASSLR